MPDKSGVSRRDIFQIIGAVPAVAALAGGPAQAAAAAGVPYKRQTFDDRQWRTVRVLCDLIIPADERSASATQRWRPGVPRRLDRLSHGTGRQSEPAGRDPGRHHVARSRKPRSCLKKTSPTLRPSSRSRSSTASPIRSALRKRITMELRSSVNCAAWWWPDFSRARWEWPICPT